MSGARAHLTFPLLITTQRDAHRPGGGNLRESGAYFTGL